MEGRQPTAKFEQYGFNRDALASTRLNLQHQLWASNHGFILHPEVVIPENATIADIGCGTGIWSLSLAKQLEESSENATIEAFDISLAQTPPRQWCPSNVSFRQMNIFEPLSQELVGRYDVVHIRLFMCVVENGDPMPLLRQLLKLLKPGGYLHWQEYDPKGNTIILADPTTAVPKLEALNAIFETPGVAPEMNWVLDLHTRFGKEGGELRAKQNAWTSREMLGLKQDITFLAVREWCANQRSKGQNETADKLEALCAEVEEECWKLGRGSVIDTPMITWVVRKK